MGGDYSIRWNDHRKARTVENCASVSTVNPRDHQLTKLVGVMRPDKTSQWVIRCDLDDRDTVFQILASENEQPQLRISIADVGGKAADGTSHTISYLNTKPHLGGDRWWFCCPLCSRRVSFIYLPPKASHFACRLCHNLAYLSSQKCHPGDPLASLQHFYDHCHKVMGK